MSARFPHKRSRSERGRNPRHFLHSRGRSPSFSKRGTGRTRIALQLPHLHHRTTLGLSRSEEPKPASPPWTAPRLQLSLRLCQCLRRAPVLHLSYLLGTRPPRNSWVRLRLRLRPQPTIRGSRLLRSTWPNSVKQREWHLHKPYDQQARAVNENGKK